MKTASVRISVSVLSEVKKLAKAEDRSIRIQTERLLQSALALRKPKPE